MIITKYPDEVEVQLQILDERIAEIHKLAEEMKGRSPMEDKLISRNTYEATKPYVDAKVRLMTTCRQVTYIFDLKAEKSEAKE